MKSFLIIVFLSLTFNSSKDNWFCFQIGESEKPSIVYTDVFKSSNAVDSDTFSQFVKKKFKDFFPSFGAQCVAFESKKEAEKNLKLRLEYAEKYKLNTIVVKFPEIKK